jgi:hypothetical protein
VTFSKIVRSCDQRVGISFINNLLKFLVV